MSGDEEHNNVGSALDDPFQGGVIGVAGHWVCLPSLFGCIRYTPISFLFLHISSRPVPLKIMIATEDEYCVFEGSDSIGCRAAAEP